MIQDLINNNSHTFDLKNKCYACNMSGHCVQKCNKIHFCPDKEKIIKKNEFSFPQVRQVFTRKKNKKKKMGLFKAIKIEINDAPDSDERSSINSGDYSSEYNVQDNSDIQEKEKDTEEYKKEEFYDSNYLPIEPQSRKLSSKHVNDRPSIIFNSQQEPRISLNSDSVPRKSQSELTQEKEKMESSVRVPTKIKSKIMDKEPESEISSIVNQLNEFDKIQNYKKYFPEMNFESIQKIFNENNNSYYTNNKRKAHCFKKYSMYTFNINSMYTLINRRRKMKTRSLKSYTKESSNKKSQPDAFVNFIKKTMELIKKKKEAKKWFHPFLRLIKKK